MPDTFTSPGAAATSALFEFLAQRDAQRRQEMLDELTHQKAEQDRQLAMQKLGLDQRQMRVNEARADYEREATNSLREQREAAAEANRQKRAIGVMATLKPKQNIKSSTSDILVDRPWKTLRQKVTPKRLSAKSP